MQFEVHFGVHNVTFTSCMILSKCNVVYFLECVLYVNFGYKLITCCGFSDLEHARIMNTHMLRSPTELEIWTQVYNPY